MFEVTLSVDDSLLCAILKLQLGQLDRDVLCCHVLLLLSVSYGSSISLGQFILKIAKFLTPTLLEHLTRSLLSWWQLFLNIWCNSVLTCLLLRHLAQLFSLHPSPSVCKKYIHTLLQIQKSVKCQLYPSLHYLQGCFPVSNFLCHIVREYRVVLIGQILVFHLSGKSPLFNAHFPSRLVWIRVPGTSWGTQRESVQQG